MNKHISKKLSTLENFIIHNRHNIKDDPYKNGILNGMIFSHSIFTGTCPNYTNIFSKNHLTKIRHKCKK